MTVVAGAGGQAGGVRVRDPRRRVRRARLSPRRSREGRDGGARGFTLLEILLALALIGLFAGVLVSVSVNLIGDRPQTLGTVGIYYTLLGADGFGAVDWREPAAQTANTVH